LVSESGQSGQRKAVPPAGHYQMIVYSLDFAKQSRARLRRLQRPSGLLLRRPSALPKGALPLWTPHPRRREARGAGVAGFALRPCPHSHRLGRCGQRQGFGFARVLARSLRFAPGCGLRARP